MSNFDEKDLLTRALRERSSDVGGHPIGLDSVRRSAKRIQRRRQIVTGAVAVAVAGVALPTGIAVTSSLTTGERPSGNSSFAATPTPTPTAPATPRGPVALTTDLPVGEVPRIPYFERGDLVVPDGPVLELDNVYNIVLAYDGGWIAQGYAGDGDQVFFLDEDGRVKGEPQDSGQGIVASADGSHVAYVIIEEDGSQTLVNAPVSGTDPVTWSFPATPAVLPVGFADDDTVVYELMEGGEPQGVFTAGPGSVTEELPGLIGATSAGGGTVTGVVSENLGDTCSAVIAVPGGERLWETCEYSMYRVSPDGRWILASDAYQSGFGFMSMSILDLRTGTPVMEFEQENRRGQVTLGEFHWEDDGFVVAPVNDKVTWSILRLGVDGSLENAITPFEDDMTGEWPIWFNR